MRIDMLISAEDRQNYRRYSSQKFIPMQCQIRAILILMGEQAITFSWL